MCLRKLNKVNVTKFETNKAKNYYFHKSKIYAKSYSPSQENEIINIYPDVCYQQFLGMGAAITEAAAYSYSLLPDSKKSEFMQDHFSTLNYSLCRISIGSCDFSLGSYSYAKKSDLSDFSIERDKKYIIPFIKDALKVNPNLKFLASPWSPPKFMKTTKNLFIGGKLLDKYKQTYADYIVKFINSYKSLGINIDFITVQNEPNARMIWESCLFNADEEAEFVAKYLYPTFQKNSIKTKIIIYDHNKEKLYSRALSEFNNPAVAKAAAGIGFHWYTGDHFENISLCRETFPDKLLIHTEGCLAYQPDEFSPNQYVRDITGDFNHGVNGYLDWNILLDSKGGPNHKRNFCNSPVMLTDDNSDYIKTLSYYYIGHFSRFIKLGSHRIAFSKYIDTITITAFKNPDNSIVIVIANRNDYSINYNICMNDIMFKDTLNPQSMITYVIK